MTCTWLIGFFITGLADVLHTGMTPFADITLLSFNTALSVPMQMVLAIIFLREVFIWRYDVPALILILSGSAWIILTANFTEVDLTVEILKSHLSSIKAIIFLVSVFTLMIITHFIEKRLLRNLALFEQAVEQWL